MTLESCWGKITQIRMQIALFSSSSFSYFCIPICPFFYWLCFAFQESREASCEIPVHAITIEECEELPLRPFLLLLLFLYLNTYYYICFSRLSHTVIVLFLLASYIATAICMQCGNCSQRKGFSPYKSYFPVVVQ